MKRLVIALLALFILHVAPFATRAQSLTDFAFHPHPGATLPLSTTLRDERGHEVALGSFFTRAPVIVLLEYLRCKSLCGVTLQNVITVALDALPWQAGRDFQLVAISIDPRDRPADAAAAKAKYVGLYDRPGGEAGFHFLTAKDEGSIRRIADTIGFPYRYDRKLDEFIHPAGFIIASPRGDISRYVEGVQVTPSTLTDDLEAAAHNQSSGPLTRILLFCHIQGAPLGRYTIPVFLAFMLANAAAVVALVTVFARVLRSQG